MNERVMELNQEEDRLNEEINIFERNQVLWENQRQKIEEKSAEAVQLYKKLQ